MSDRMDCIVRERRTEERVRAMDAPEIVEEIHGLEDCIAELESRPHDEVLLHDMELMQRRIDELKDDVALLETGKQAAIRRGERLFDENKRLTEEIDLIKDPIYCRVCGSCGEDMCCDPSMCKGGAHCLYPDYAKEARDEQDG